MNSHGLGLNISKNIAEILGYELFVESELRNGTTFTLRLKVTGRVIDTRNDSSEIGTQ